MSPATVLSPSPGSPPQLPCRTAGRTRPSLRSFLRRLQELYGRSVMLELHR